MSDEVTVEVARHASNPDLAQEAFGELIEAILSRGLRRRRAALGAVAMRWGALPRGSTRWGRRWTRSWCVTPKGKGTVMGDFHWEQLATARLERGSPRVPAAALAFLAREGGSPEAGWQVLHRAAKEARQPWRVARPGVAAGARGQDCPPALALVPISRARAAPANRGEASGWVGDDERRARAVASLIPPFQVRLPELLRLLLARFGPDSAVARRSPSACTAQRPPSPASRVI